MQLAVIELEQQHLPGMDRAGQALKGRPPLMRRDSPAQLPLMVPVSDRDPDWSPTKPPTIHGQLTLGPQQMTLDENQPGPQQLALLPDPPPWEMPDKAPAIKPQKGRLSRRRNRSGISPGQTSFF